MSNLPDYKSCEVRLEFGDDEYLFRLPLKQVASLQDKCGAGIGAVYTRVVTYQYRVEDLIEIVRLGLIGGGEVSGASEANKLIARYTDQWPLEHWHKMAIAILAACVHGYADPNAEAKPKPKSDEPYAHDHAQALGDGNAMGLNPDEVDDLTMWQFGALKSKWNQRHADSDDVEPPTDDEFEEMRERAIELGMITPAAMRKPSGEPMRL